jgi:deazaflavin-dependent oxidoreductase (nitroreductase family)
MTARPSGIIRPLLRAPVYLYRWRCGRLLGHRFLLLIHTGRRTGRRRETVLEVVEYRKAGPELVVISAFGHNADWLRNIAAAPEPEVIVGRERFVAVYRTLDAEEAIGVIERYERRNRLIAPIVRLVLSRLLGGPYRGSASDRRRLVAELPLVAFRPR